MEFVLDGTWDRAYPNQQRSQANPRQTKECQILNSNSRTAAVCTMPLLLLLHHSYHRHHRNEKSLTKYDDGKQQRRRRRWRRWTSNDEHAVFSVSFWAHHKCAIKAKHIEVGERMSEATYKEQKSNNRAPDWKLALTLKIKRYTHWQQQQQQQPKCHVREEKALEMRINSLLVFGSSIIHLCICIRFYIQELNSQDYTAPRTTTIRHGTRSSAQFEFLSINGVCNVCITNIRTIRTHFIIYHYYNEIHCYRITHQCRHFDVITVCVYASERESLCMNECISSWSMMLIILICVIGNRQNETNSNWIDGNDFNSFIHFNHCSHLFIYSFIHSTCKPFLVAEQIDTQVMS